MKYTIKGCRERAKWYTDLADYMQECETIIAQGNPYAMDEARQMYTAKLIYIYTQSTIKAAQWAFENMPGYSRNITKAQERIKQDIQNGKCGDDQLDKLCMDIYERNRAAMGYN